MTVNGVLSRSSRLVRESLQPTNVPPRVLLAASVTLFVLAFGVRLLHWQNNWLTVDDTMNKTAAGYKQDAQLLTDGDFSSFIRGRAGQPDTAKLTHPPGYPVLIAVVDVITRRSSIALRLVHIGFGAAAAVVVLLIAAELLPITAALVSGLFAAISPQLSYYSLVFLPDSVIALPLVTGIYLLVRAYKRPNACLIAGTGVCMGISCWLRADVLLLAPFLCLLLPFLFSRGQRLRYAALLVTATVLTIAPITIRNLLVFKSFVPVSLGSGVILVEGIADYDPTKQFGLERYDHEVTRQEAVMYNRPDYAEDLFRPDGISRERLRIARAWRVVSGNRVWFMRVMARRAAKMLTYEPVPIISTEASVSHVLDVSRGELVWHTEQLGVGDFATEPINVQSNTDYVLNVSLRSLAGRKVIKILRPDKNKTVASATVPDSLSPSDQSDELTILQIPFLNSSAQQVRIVGQNLDDDSTIVGAIDLYRLGTASYMWTGYPRMAVKAMQKFFTTKTMLPLTLTGVLLLVLARRFDALTVILAIPVYYVTTHSPLHLELRYVLPMHYFWAILVATSLYFFCLAAWKLIRKFKSLQRDGERVFQS